jgi:hypothetical protein
MNKIRSIKEAVKFIFKNQGFFSLKLYTKNKTEVFCEGLYGSNDLINAANVLKKELIKK